MSAKLSDLSVSHRVTLAVGLMFVLATVLLTYLNVTTRREAYVRDSAISWGNRVERNAQRLVDGINTLRRDVMFLANTPPVQAIIRASQAQGSGGGDSDSFDVLADRLQVIFSSLAAARPEYYQIRYIGLADDGRELVRVDVVDSRPVVTPPDRLQGKADRDYFQATLPLPAGQVYVSEINLNREFGEIQTPHIRTLRVATPVYGPGEVLFGMVVINTDVGDLLDSAVTNLPPGVEAYITNDSGDYLAHPDASRSFGFDLRQRYTWQQDMPALRVPPEPGRIEEGPLQTVPTPTGLFHVAVERVPLDPSNSERFLLLAYALPDSLVRTELTGVVNRTIVTMTVIGLVLVGALLLLLRRAFAPLTQLTTLAETIGAGHYGVALPETGVGEFGSFIRAFRKMRDGINARKEENQASLARARALLEAAPDPVVIADAEGRITLINERTETAFGYVRAELLGQPFEMLIPEYLDGAHVAHRAPYQEIPQVRTMGVGRDLFARRKDGSEFAVDVSLSPLETPEGTLSISTVRDITDRKDSDRRIRGQLERLNLLDHITRAVGDRQDLKSIFQVVVRNLEDSLPADFVCVCLYDAAEEALSVTCVGVNSAALVQELTLNEQARIDVDDNGLGRCVHGELVYEPDIGELAYPFPERLARGGLGAVVMAPLKSESRVFGMLMAARREARSFSSVECEFLRQLSEHVALAAHQAQLYEALKQAYDDLRQTQETMMQEERLRALGQMASGIAHDINNALSPVSLYTESMLETESGLSERGRGYLEVIRRAVEDVAETVARMREFYRPREQQLELSPVALNELVRQVLDLTRARWSDMAQSHGIVVKVVTELAPELPKIMGVESEIREALTNLIFNAVDAMPEGGTLTLRTRIAGGDAEGSAVMEVVDTGIGMDEKTQIRCLEPFFTTKGERGTGLGLAMVFGMVQRHSCEFEIDSTLGEGTTMRLVFAVQTGALDATEHLPALQIPKRLRLLLVDDDPMLLKSLRDALETDGHVIVTASGGEEGIAAFHMSQDRDERFAAVITDLGMPYVDGRRVAEAVKEISPDTPVIMLTGWGRRLEAEGDIPPHVDKMLAKPPKLREVREALVVLCRERARA